MAIQKRQSNLYAGEDWKQIYEAFRVINLQAYDFDTIRESMIQYLRITYPDSFNNWIENDEFIFILDTISFLGQNLAFRMDMNSRENFLDTAERRSSVLKLAKMISYSPRRSYPSRGLAKLTEIKTNQDLKNSSGKSLRNVTIRWNDPLDSEWQENFFLVMNHALISSNQFGDPIKKNINNGVTSSIYRLNTLPMTSPSIPFTANINGENMNMEVVNPDINAAGFFEERHPEPQMQHHIIYQNDGNGFNSPRTGFFVYFKQGTLSYSDFEYSQPIENRVQNIDVDNINEIDVWVQEITDDGIIRAKWNKVPALESVAYTSVNRQLKNIYSITTMDKDRIMLKFPDARSGNVPRGTYRVWHRVSNGKTYTIKTNDIQNKSVQYTYRSKGQTKYQNSTLDVKFTLQYQVQNSQTRETIGQIKERAPQLFYTQNRFVNGEDYNIAPLMMGNTVLKSKAINRIYSGQSRFIDIVDPTGKYQNTDVFSDDGAIYRDDINAVNNSSVLLPTTKTNVSIVVDNIQPLIGDISVIQRFQEDKNSSHSVTTIQNWITEFNSKYTMNTYGYIQSASPTNYQIGSLIQFSQGTSLIWVSVIDKIGDKLVLSKPINSGWSVKTYIAPFRIKFNNSEVRQIASMVDKKNDFILIYQSSTSTWIPILGSFPDNRTYTYQGEELPILVRAVYNSVSWDFSSIGVKYIFIGGDKVRFYFVGKHKITDISSGNTNNDKINILSYNVNPINDTKYSSNIEFQIIDTMNQENGYLDGSRAIITASELDINGIPLNPNLFREIVPQYTDSIDKLKYSQQIILRTNQDFTIDYIKIPNDEFTYFDSSWTYTMVDVNNEISAYKRAALQRNVQMRSTNIGDLYNRSSGFVIGFEYDNKKYFIEQIVSNNNDRLSNLTRNLSEPSDVETTVEMAFSRAIENMSNSTLDETKKLTYYGYKNVSAEYIIRDDARVNINFHWKHYAPEDNRIDPSKTNLIDMYVLTNSYRSEVDLWVKNRDGSMFPRPPSSTELRDMFQAVESKIVVSDSIIWHSARYLPLFGDSADDNYKANFKVIRTPNSKFSDDEIRQKVIELTNYFFNVQNWDFGESFYFTELSTFIHQQLATDIASIVIVPQNPNSKFGELFEIPCESDQLFVSTATVNNVIIVNSLAKTNINIGN